MGRDRGQTGEHRGSMAVAGPLRWSNATPCVGQAFDQALVVIKH